MICIRHRHVTPTDLAFRVLARTVTHALVGLDPRGRGRGARARIAVVHDRRPRRPRLPGGEGARAQRHPSAELEFPCAASPSTSRRPRCGRRVRASTCRSRSRSSPRRNSCRPTRSTGSPRSASSHSTGACGRCPVRSSRRRAPVVRGRRSSSARPSRRRRWRSQASSLSPVLHLADAVAYLRGEYDPPPPTPPRDGDAARRRSRPRRRPRPGAARRAIEIAAAGGHNVLLAGPPGTGKTMLARRLPGILPLLGDEDALEVTRIHSVAGCSRPAPGLSGCRRSARRTIRRRCPR